MEIFADLNSSGIYLSGETVKCQVTFFNTHEFHPETVQDKLEHLAWASVQIQCICQVATPSGTGVQIVLKSRPFSYAQADLPQTFSNAASCQCSVNCHL